VADNPNSEPKTDREKYIENLETKLQKAGKARRFLEQEDGSIVTDWLTQQINVLLKQIAGKAMLDKPSEYAYTVGQLHGYQKLLTMLNSEANTDGKDLQEKLEAAKTDG
jgi:hypothetical protein